jgi:hypothetical protein
MNLAMLPGCAVCNDRLALVLQLCTHGFSSSALCAPMHWPLLLGCAMYIDRFGSGAQLGSVYQLVWLNRASLPLLAVDVKSFVAWNTVLPLDFLDSVVLPQ